MTALTKGLPSPETPVPSNDHLDQHDRAAVAAAQANRDARPVQVEDGDYVRFADGQLRRVSHVWRFPADKDGPAVFSVQTSRGGSWHMSTPAGHVSFSGGLDSGRPGDAFTDTGERLDGSVWVWHHGRPAAHNGVAAVVSFRVWASTDVAP
ncbi:MAG: hypothetical protein JWP27_3065 [Flaviaesturariibacter sp.]|nr:hypothetical protein [Flaviaesturariibacter sp.]